MPLLGAAALGAAAAVFLYERTLRPPRSAPVKNNVKRDSSSSPVLSGALPWAGRNVIITGASSGIGRACAILFARLGARVAIHYNDNEAGARETWVACGGGPGHGIFRSDFGIADNIERTAVALIEETTLFFNAVPDVLVLNAGIVQNGNADTLTSLSSFMSIWRRTMTINLDAPAALTYVFARALVKTRGANANTANTNGIITAIGAIVTIGSRGALRGEPNAWAYGASKAAAHALSQNAAVSLGRHGIVVTVVAPGFVATRMARFESPAIAAAVNAQSPWSRVGLPEEVAAAVEFAARFFEVPWVTGAVINLNGASYLSR